MILKSASQVNLSRDWLFLMIAVLTLCVNLSLMFRSPIVWQDEVQIVDYSRTIFNPTSDWAVTSFADGKPYRPLNLIGYAYLNSFLSIFGFSFEVVRAISIVSGLLLGLSFFYLLRIFGMAPRWAAWLSLALICDPMLAKSIRGCRIDAVACAAGFLAIAFWLKALQAEKPLLYATLSGIFSVSAIFIWATALIFIGGYVAFCLRSGCDKRTEFLRVLGMTITVGICLTVLILSGTIWILGWDLLKASLNAMKSPGVGNFVFGWEQVKFFLKFTLTNPVAWVLFLVLLWSIHRKQISTIKVLLPFACSLLICLAIPPLYMFRFVYVIPWIYLAMVEGLQKVNWSMSVWVRSVTLLMVAYSVIGRLWITVPAWQTRDYDRYAEELTAVIPRGAVIYGSATPYYAGLKNGWQLYCYFAAGQSPSNELSKRFHYLVLDNADMFPRWLNRADFELIKHIDLSDKIHNKSEGYRATVYRKRIVAAD